MNGGELNATQIRVLQEPGWRLQTRRVHSDVNRIGGAALLPQGIGNRPTADVDARVATTVRGLGPVQWKQKRSRK